MPAGANFFATMKISLLSDRDFTARDDENAPKIAVINEAFAKLYFQNQNPIGQHIQWDRKNADTDMEIVGVAKDARYNSLRADASPPSTIHSVRRGESFSCTSKCAPPAIRRP